MPTFAVDLDTRRFKIKNGTYPVKLYVDYNDVPNTYDTIYDMTLEEWQTIAIYRKLLLTGNFFTSEMA